MSQTTVDIRKRRYYKIRKKPKRSIDKLMGTFNADPSKLKLFKSPSLAKSNISFTKSSSYNRHNKIQSSSTNNQNKSNTETKKRLPIKIKSYFKPANETKSKKIISSSSNRESPNKFEEKKNHFQTQQNSPKRLDSRNLGFSSSQRMGSFKRSGKGVDIRKFIGVSKSYSRGGKSELKEKIFASGGFRKRENAQKCYINQFFVPKKA